MHLILPGAKRPEQYRPPVMLIALYASARRAVAPDLSSPTSKTSTPATPSVLFAKLSGLLLRNRQKARKAIIARRITPTPTPTPIPIVAVCESPEEDGDAVGLGLFPVPEDWPPATIPDVGVGVPPTSMPVVKVS
jgi:hypothetical protein